MARSFEYPIANSKGLSKAIFFTGLYFPLVICPALHGEPLLTVQPFYYLEQLEAVARSRFEKESDIPRHSSESELERIIEYVIDNYLFEYIRVHKDSTLSGKITEYPYWRNSSTTYMGYDGNCTMALTLDALNDPSIIDLSTDDMPNKDHFLDWCLIKSYSFHEFDQYLKKLKNAVSKSVQVKTKDHDELGTNNQEMPIVLPAKGLLDFYQADSLEVINVDYNRIEKDKIRVSRGLSPDDGFSIPKEDIHTTTYYNRDLLSYFFCAIKEKLPIIQFRSFYNVLEFLFEEAPKQMHFNVKTERQQIRCVISWITTKWEVSSFLNSLDSDIVKNLVKPYEIEPGIEIEGLTLSSGHILESIADFIYSYRCACVHSKKTIKGAQSVRLIPYTKDEDRVAYLVPLMQWLSIKCMEKDAKMTNYRLVD